MAMIKCPECGREVSSIAKECPSCGYPISGMSSVSIKVPSNEEMRSWGAIVTAKDAKLFVNGTEKWKGLPGQTVKIDVDGPTKITLGCGEVVVSGTVNPGKSYECTAIKKLFGGLKCELFEK